MKVIISTFSLTYIIIYIYCIFDRFTHINTIPTRRYANSSFYVIRPPPGEVHFSDFPSFLVHSTLLSPWMYKHKINMTPLLQPPDTETWSLCLHSEKKAVICYTEDIHGATWGFHKMNNARSHTTGLIRSLQPETRLACWGKTYSKNVMYLWKMVQF